jgi:hypothetical protein
MLLLEIALMGGFFAVLAFIHFFVDWIFQSHAEAMVKHNNPKVRAKHCLIYTLGFVPLFCLCNFSWIEWLFALNLLFWSHFYLDTYHGVYLWAKYIRKPPEMTELRKQVTFDGYVHHTSLLPPDSKAGFVDFIQTPLGKILMISIDQISHLSCLWPIVYMIMSHIK